jgi:hypothetical protein
MRIGPFELTRRRALAAATEPAAAPYRAEGASGTVILNGFLQQIDEFNRDLAWPNSIDVFDRMQRSDGSVQEALAHITEPVKNATWSVAPASEDPDDLEIAEFGRCAYFEWLEQPWTELLDQTLDYLVYGHALFEVTEKVVDAELRYADPAAAPSQNDAGRREQPEIVKPSRQFVTFERFEQRLPRTVYRWEVEAGRLVYVQQRVYRDDTYIEPTIQAEHLLVFTNKKRGDDFTGRSLLRAAYKAWSMKELLERVDAMAVERHGVGTWVAYPPQAHANDDGVLDRLEQILVALRAGSYSYIVSPGPRQTATQDGYLFEVISPGGQLPDITPRLNYHRAEIKAAVLARFAELGHAQTGARATGDTQSKVWYDALHAVASYICEVHQPRLEALVRANYGDVARFPKLCVSDIEARNLQEFADSVAKLVASGAVEADRSFRSFVRQGLDAPEEDNPEQVDELRQPPDPTAPVDENGQPVEQDNPKPAGGGTAAAALADVADLRLFMERRDREHTSKLDLLLGRDPKVEVPVHVEGTRFAERSIVHGLDRADLEAVVAAAVPDREPVEPLDLSPLVDAMTAGLTEVAETSRRELAALEKRLTRRRRFSIVKDKDNRPVGIEEE